MHLSGELALSVSQARPSAPAHQSRETSSAKHQCRIGKTPVKYVGNEQVAARLQHLINTCLSGAQEATRPGQRNCHARSAVPERKVPQAPVTMRGALPDQPVNIRGKPPIPPNSRKVYSLDFALQNRSRYAGREHLCNLQIACVHGSPKRLINLTTPKFW